MFPQEFLFSNQLQSLRVKPFHSEWSSPVNIPRHGSGQLSQVIEDPELYQQCLVSKSAKITIIFLLTILQMLTLENSKLSQKPLIVTCSKVARISIRSEFARGLQHLLLVNHRTTSVVCRPMRNTVPPNRHTKMRVASELVGVPNNSKEF